MAWSLQTDWWRASHLALLHLTPNRHSVQPLETVCFVWVFVGCISCLDSPAAMMTATVDDMYFCFPFWTHRLCEWKHPLLRRIISISSTGLFIHVAHKSIAIGSTCIPNVCASQQRLAMHATHHCACDLMGVNFKKWKHTYVFFDFDGETGIFRYFTLKHNSVVIDSGIRLWKKKNRMATWNTWNQCQPQHDEIPVCAIAAKWKLHAYMHAKNRWMRTGPEFYPLSLICLPNERTSAWRTPFRLVLNFRWRT